MPVEERNRQIVQKYLEGDSLRKLSLEYSVSHERIRQILNLEGVQTRKRGKPEHAKVSRSRTFGKLTTRERFFTKVKKVADPVQGEHWVWLGSWMVRRAYGRFMFRGKIHYAHYAAYFLTKGKWPKGTLRNTCAVECCVNPEHWREILSRTESK